MYENKIEQAGDFLKDPLDLASRDELYELAKKHGVKEIDEAMYMGGYAGQKMKKILRAKGLTNLKPSIQLFKTPEPEQPSGKTMTLDELVNDSRPPTMDNPAMTRAEMAKECKRRGIKMARTDTKEKLQERLSVPHAA